MSLPTHKTKIVATIGPASRSPEILEAMIRAGMNVARLNFSHGDFAEHLGLRTRAELLAAIDAASLRVVDRSDVQPQHPRVSDTSDPLHAARAAEVTSLWRLAVR